MLNIIKKLDKENTSLKETNKSNNKNFHTSLLFLKCFQKERKEWEERNKRLELENNILVDELRKQNNKITMNNYAIYLKIPSWNMEMIL